MEGKIFLSGGGLSGRDGPGNRSGRLSGMTAGRRGKLLALAGICCQPINFNN
jgi:hypothetical protein